MFLNFKRASRLFVSASALMVASTLWAQNTHEVSGRVVDETGEPVVGAAVVIAGTTTGTVTDIDGNFSIDAPADGTLSVSFIGYETQNIPVNGQSSVNFTLVDEASELDEVVAIGFGTVKKRDVTGSVASVKAETLLQTPTSDVSTSLQGRVTGLDVAPNSDGDLQMRIRGNRSINGSNDPLVIIDGVMGGSMSDLNPQDIESVDVLKDASSTAIYGSQGANGVIIITTKKAEQGHMQITYDGYVSGAFRVEHPDYRSGNNYYEARRIAAANAGMWNSKADDRLLFDSDEAYAAFLAGAWTNYEDLLQKDLTVSQKHTVTMSGGNEKTSARFSLGFANNGSKWEESRGSDRYTLRGNIDHKLYDWISAGVTFQLTHNRSVSSPYEKATTTAMELGSPYGYYDSTVPNGVDEIVGSYIIGNTLVERPLAADGYVNPLLDYATGKLYSAESYSTNAVANMYLDLHPTDYFSVRTQFDTHLTNSSKGSYVDANSAAQIDATTYKSTASMTKTSSTYMEWNNILNYNFKKLLPSDHNLGITLLTSWSNKISDNLSATSIGQSLSSNLWWNLANNNGEDGSSTHSSGYTRQQTFSYAGRLSYDYKGRYLATVSIRRDGASQLADGHKWDTFPSAALAWRISDEAFMDNTREWLDDLKIRATYGVTGNAGIGVYGTQSGITFANWSFGFQDEAANRYILGKVDSGYYIVANKDTKWEKSYTTDLGFDLTMLNSRITVNFDWYNTNTEDLILLRSLPTSAGVDGKYATYTNIGSTRNHGVEIGVQAHCVNNDNFKWTANLSFSANKETIEELVEGTDIQVGNTKETSTLMIGHPIKSYKTFDYKGIWKSSEADQAATYFTDDAMTISQKPGDIKVADLNGDNIISETDDVKYLGSTSPKWFAGFNNDFSFLKNWDLNLYFYARWGHWGDSPTAAYNPSTGGDYVNLNYWVEGSNEGGDLPALRKSAKLSDYRGYQSLSYCEQSFVKLKRVSLGYTLPKAALDAIHIQKIRVYATVNDPLHFVKNDWLDDRDPEGSQRSVTLGLNINL